MKNKLSCIRKNRNNHGIIIGYVLQDCNGNQRVFHREAVKNMLMQQKDCIDNLKLTSDGRIISVKVDSKVAKRETRVGRVMKVVILKVDALNDLCVIGDEKMNVKKVSYRQLCSEVKAMKIKPINAELKSLSQKEYESEYEYLTTYCCEEDKAKKIMQIYNECGFIEVKKYEIKESEYKKYKIDKIFFWDVIRIVNDIYMQGEIDELSVREYMIKLGYMLRTFLVLKLSVEQRVGFEKELSKHMYSIYNLPKDEYENYLDVIPFGDDTFKDIVSSLILMYGKEVFEEFKKDPKKTFKKYKISSGEMHYEAEELAFSAGMDFDVEY